MTTATAYPDIKLSKASKMPCQSYSLPAQECKTGSKLRKVEGSTCSKCYALKGRYLFPSVKDTRYHNFAHINMCEHDMEARQDWIDQLVIAACDRFFRWFDSGDLQGVWMLEMLAGVAKAAPWCQFWLPTREHAMVTDYLLEHGSFPINMIVRLSAHMLDKPITINKAMQEAGVLSSTAGNVEGKQCDSRERKGKCGPCRACWNRDVASVNYPLH